MEILLDNINSSIPLKWIDFDDYKQLCKLSLVVDGKETVDQYLEICAIGNHIKFESEPEIYKVENILSQNGPLDPEIDIYCVKV